MRSPKIGEYIKFKANGFYDNKIFIRKILSTNNKFGKEYYVNINAAYAVGIGHYCVIPTEIIETYNKEDNPEYFL